ncbi:hypothetical protein HJC23_002061 [Cyclotella cryptica]|uniref:Uncharacterized protein n=1 Tax=Cyclotella cryptica TaxID=29204 RepID=A0ABD3Q588_9STRA|eukprot:CCRYP_008294-RA/>CCRYP_008294-RA protein AED:0.05 eAED:0.05 QI:256/1/1/1/0.5/0.33/3/625/260
MSQRRNTIPAIDAPIDFSSCSVESMLSIPTKFIFLKTRAGPTPTQQRCLFSRSEVSTLLQVSMLASEMDVILSLVYEALDRSNKCKLYRKSIESGKGNLYLRALLPLFDVHAETAANALNHVTSESFGIHQILSSLDACAVELKKFSEQNWNMAEQLSWMIPGQSHLLSSEKRAIAELEDAVAERIFHLKDISTLHDAESNCNDSLFRPMQEFCSSLFSDVVMPMARESLSTEQSDVNIDYSTSQLNAAEALKLLGGKPE